MRTRRPPSNTARIVVKLLLAVGFLALAVAAWRARTAPATGYELSIYQGTPWLVWVAAAVALGTALIGLALSPPGPTRGAGVVLGGGTVLTLVSLPLLRGYAFFGAGDALTHLGWTREIAAGAFSPTSLLYPADHLIAVQTHLLTGVPVSRALLLVIPLFVLVYLVFIPLTVRAADAGRWTVPAAAVCSWLLLPLDQVGVFLEVYPTTQALFFLPAILFALVAYLDRESTVTLPGGLSPFTVLLCGLGVTAVVVHPQQGLNVFVLFATGALIQAVAAWRRPSAGVTAHRSLALPALVVGGAFAAWTTRLPRFLGAAEAILATIVGGGAAAPAAIGVRGGSLVQLGGSLAELFAKLYLVESAFLLLSGVALLAVLRGRVAGGAGTLATYLGAGMIPLGALFFVYFLGSPTLAFRQLGFVLVLATVLGAVGLCLGADAIGSWRSPSAGRTVVAVALACGLVLATATMFASPFVYKPSGHVSEAAFTGYGFALDHQAEDVGYSRVALGADVNRYADARRGVDLRRGLDLYGFDPAVPPEAFSSGAVPDVYDDPRYLTVSAADRQRTVGLYDEFRYTATGYEALETTPGVNHVHANGYLDLYLVGSTKRSTALANGTRERVGA